MRLLVTFSLAVVLATVEGLKRRSPPAVKIVGPLRNEFAQFSGRPIFNVPEVSIQNAYISQPVDHFNASDHRLFDQRFFSNWISYVGTGKVFLYVEGTNPISWQLISIHHHYDWIENARHFGAFCFMLEHRYFGSSHVTADASTPNLKWLTVEQVLADIATFICRMNHFHHFLNPRWILFGCSYAGALAAWSRLKYPRLAYGAVTAGAPVLNTVEFPGYIDVVRRHMDDCSTACVDTVMNATQAIEEWIESRHELEVLMEMFQVCYPETCNLTQPKHMSTFFHQLFQTIAKVAQNGGVNKGPFTDLLTIEKICDIIINGSRGEPIQRYATAVRYILHLTDQPCVVCNYEDTVEFYQEISLPYASLRITQYLSSCSQFGQHVNTNHQHRNPFSETFPVRYYTDRCRDIFGDEFTEERLYSEVARINRKFGAKNYTATRAIFVNGMYDGVYPLSITESISNDTIAIFINGTAHCADFYPASPTDPPHLTQARHQKLQEIAKWLNY